jgi:hypothetical protein
MKVQRPTTDPKSPKPKPPTTQESDEDVEGHFMNMPTSMRLDIAKDREREVREQAARHTLVAAARERARPKR